MTSIYELIARHRVDHQRFNDVTSLADTQSPEFDPSDRARLLYANADKVERKSLMDVCAFPVITDKDRKIKAEYLIEFERKNELSRENFMAILEAESEAGSAFLPIDLSGRPIQELNTLKWRLETIGNHLEEIWQIDPCSEPSKTMPGARDLTPIGKEIEKLQNWFFDQENRIPAQMTLLGPTNAYEEEIKHHFLIKNAVDTGATLPEISQLVARLITEASPT